MTDPEVVVVGAGPHGLTAAAALLGADPGLRGRLLVADPAPWLAGWDARFARLELPVLRSACVHHPAPAPYALLDWARARGRTAELTGPVGSPGTGLFADFCRWLVTRSGLAGARVPAAVTRLRPRDDGRVEVTVGRRRVRAGAVVLAAGGARPHVPVPRARHSDRVRLSAVRPGQRVVVVGGGLTAGHLALRAADRGARVLLVVRAPLRARLMDVDAGWLGRELPGYAALPPAERAAAARRARPGTVPAAVRDALLGSGSVQVRQGTVARTAPGCVQLADGATVATDHLWLGTGSRFDVRAHPVTAGLATDVPVEVVDGLPVLGPDLSWGGTRVFLTGGLAALELGPAARGLAGARMAAERYTEAVTGVAPARRQYPAPTRSAGAAAPAARVGSPVCPTSPACR
ncbi:FAD-dependent oxidoreductase [Geodermatophilus sp. DSM 44513]|uniref:FAD-dependent oxidoreductase n=1 Tax=Geodermatophilus sp. DSM 44513 TaxID=1528104 RepID=UPI00127C55AA|nr:FAD-dependent oxidoreductase [Geodermatophilus sp. DSM 44513]WNV76978.1 FAD/NAD(P)-binding protein [Geodermatophilus sp. DSM 44513]